MLPPRLKCAHSGLCSYTRNQYRQVDRLHAKIFDSPDGHSGKPALTINHRGVFFPTTFYNFKSTFSVNTPGPNLHHETVEG
jgi:hypothetical protein